MLTIFAVEARTGARVEAPVARIVVLHARLRGLVIDAVPGNLGPSLLAVHLVGAVAVAHAEHVHRLGGHPLQGLDIAIAGMTLGGIDVRVTSLLASFSRQERSIPVSLCL